MVRTLESLYISRRLEVYPNPPRRLQDYCSNQNSNHLPCAYMHIQQQKQHANNATIMFAMSITYRSGVGLRLAVPYTRLGIR